MPRKDALTDETLRTRLQSASGKRYWRTLDELAGAPEFLEYLNREFPQSASQWTGETSRRDFLKLMAASLSLAGLSGCFERPDETIVPYVQTPEQIVPGKPLYFATAIELAGLGLGLVVESHMGRPIKVEGNPDHPASDGATNSFAQASILTLYDPDRSKVIRREGELTSRQSFLGSLEEQRNRLRGTRGRGLHLLTETISSPTFEAQIKALREQFPEMQWHQWEPVLNDAARGGLELAFGEDARDAHAVYHFDRADVVLSLDADFFSPGPVPVTYARDFIGRRRVATQGPGAPEMNRLYVLEVSPTLVGAKADHRLTVRPDELVAIAVRIAQRLGIEMPPPPGLPQFTGQELERINTWVEAVADDLQDYRLANNPGAPLVVAGDHQPPIVQALAHAMNATLGSIGTTVEYRPPIVVEPVDQLQSLRQLVDAMQAGDVATLVILGGNPVFTAPADLEFAQALQKAPYRLHLSLYYDETSRRCHWHLPQSHYLEAWGDLRASEGTPSIVQPLISPLYGTWTAHDVLSALLGEPDRTSYDVVRAYWQEQYSGGDFEDFWRRALHEGVLPRQDAEPLSVSLRSDFASALASAAEQSFGRPAGLQDGTFDLLFRPDPTIWDGRFANNGWLQELPKPLTKITWDNAALISVDTARALDVENESMVEIAYEGRTLQMPVWLLPGQPDGVMTLHFGYGRTAAGRVGNGTGFDVYRLRTSDAPWRARGATVRPLGTSYQLSTTQAHHSLEGREIVRVGTLDMLREDPQHPPFMHEDHSDPEASFYPEWDYSENDKWGMVIDQTACIGCQTCVVACQAENNIPIVGKDQVARSREMHWLRIDTYYEGEHRNPSTYFQPMMCVHCEKAPCEPVCPVHATTHSRDGLNEMTYNRCIGTRYCSNNCPYKVRRFNFLHYAGEVEQHPTLQLLQNPDVTVRSRGVMEKCTYCVQRIRLAQIEAQKEDRPVREGEVETACQAACPTNAIIFGNLNQKGSAVERLHHGPLSYAVLGELNTQPRTRHLAVVRNPNPKLVEPLKRGEQQAVPEIRDKSHAATHRLAPVFLSETLIDASGTRTTEDSPWPTCVNPTRTNTTLTRRRSGRARSSARGTRCVR